MENMVAKRRVYIGNVAKGEIVIGSQVAPKGGILHGKCSQKGNPFL